MLNFKEASEKLRFGHHLTDEEVSFLYKRYREAHEAMSDLPLERYYLVTDDLRQKLETITRMYNARKKEKSPDQKAEKLSDPRAVIGVMADEFRNLIENYVGLVNSYGVELTDKELSSNMQYGHELAKVWDYETIWLLRKYATSATKSEKEIETIVHDALTSRLSVIVGQTVLQDISVVISKKVKEALK